MIWLLFISLSSSGMSSYPFVNWKKFEIKFNLSLFLYLNKKNCEGPQYSHLNQWRKCVYWSWREHYTALYIFSLRAPYQIFSKEIQDVLKTETLCIDYEKFEWVYGNHCNVRLPPAWFSFFLNRFWLFAWVLGQ